jgi:ParB/RepB/Spo0J family partition protein
VADVVELIDPRRIEPNPENPRLIFREDELLALQQSIEEQGILVPLALYRDGKKFVLLDGERRWRCATKLGLSTVPALVQPKPDRLQNIMMMFAIHNAREDWDPLPTAYKLRELEEEFERRQGHLPTEAELAGLASIPRGEVRRLRNLLALPAKYRKLLMAELEKPQSERRLSVDHVLETTRGAAALRKRGVLDAREEDRLRTSILRKFREGVIDNTVAPRQLARIARAVEREEVSGQAARRVALKIIEDPKFTIDDAFRASVEQVDFEHGTEQLAGRLVARLETIGMRDYEAGETLASTLRTLRRLIDRVLN